jgi:hypothetical protein
MTTLKSIVYAYADGATEWNTSEWRGRSPSDGLNRSGRYRGRCISIADFANYGHPAVQAIIGQADAIVVQRNLLTSDVWTACDYWRGLGKLVVADLDDDYPHLCPQNPAYAFWILDVGGLKDRTGYAPVEALTEGFRHVDALISPNELILQDWADVVPGYWVPNYANGLWYEGIEQKPLPGPDEPIIIGWGGSVSHWDGWWFSGLREAVPRITEKYPRVMWKICGGDGRVKKFFDALVPDRWINQDGVPPQEWPKQVASFDIGLAPLCGPEAPQAESYDQHRSWLKAVEYLLAGVPWVASEGIVYEKLDGQGGFVVENSPSGWERGLMRVLDGLETYKAESKKLMPWAVEHLTIDGAVDEYMEAFERIWTERNAAQRVRLPNVWFAGDWFTEVDEISGVTVERAEDDRLEVLADYQRRTFELVSEWTDAMGLDRAGVDMGLCLRYPVLHELNARAFRALEAIEGQSND